MCKLPGCRRLRRPKHYVKLMDHRDQDAIALTFLISEQLRIRFDYFYWFHTETKRAYSPKKKTEKMEENEKN